MIQTKHPHKYSTYRSCTRKNTYYTSKEANRKIRDISQREGVRLHYYHCLQCNHYHLTHQEALTE